MNEIAPWTDAGWRGRAHSRMGDAFSAAGRPSTGPIHEERRCGRSYLYTVPTADGTVWVKHGYGLPPGEEKVLPALSKRWPERLPRIIATWPGALAMEPLRGSELEPDHPGADWVSAAQALAEIEAGEVAHAGEWLDLGVRDRRPATWDGDIAKLLDSPVLGALDPEVRKRFEGFVPEFIERYVEAFQSPATLVHQDSGCCNIHISDDGPVFFDWADVVVGHPIFSCDRLLDQAPASYHESIIGAFREPLGLTLDEFRAMRRSNVLHEVLRYHDELAYLAPEDPAYESLANSVRSQIQVLVEHETARR